MGFRKSLLNLWLHVKVTGSMQECRHSVKSQTAETGKGETGSPSQSGAGLHCSLQCTAAGPETSLVSEANIKKNKVKCGNFSLREGGVDCVAQFLRSGGKR